MNINLIAQSLVKFSNLRRLPPTTLWPSTIYLNPDIDSNLKRIYSQTSSSGHEFETAIFLVGTDMIHTPLFKGTKQNVRVSHKVAVEFVPRGSSYERRVVADGNVVNVKNIGAKVDPSQNAINFVFNIHSHPVHVNAKGQVTYSFFSVVDMNSFLASNALIMGLVTNRFWLVCKTDKTISKIGENGEEMLYRISEGAFGGISELDDLIKKEMNRWGMIFYKGDLGRPLTKI